ncbi:cryptochrome/photolyase family protein [Streptomyces huasconensis]|uniref:cryptochrome/photolyase family protein n=1 Tax=Streptomyces huasconensis TaxID=1854574 RepID=UPI0036F5EAB6
MNTSIVLFTSDLRVHDHPPLRAALAGADAVVPLFVLDRAIEDIGFAGPNRKAFLADCLADLDRRLRDRGGRLVVRGGDLVEQVRAVMAEADAADLHLAAGVSRYAHDRERRLREALAADGRRLHVHDAVITAVPPGEVTPAGSDHFAVFSPYFRRWSGCGPRAVLGAPRAVRVPDHVRSHPLPAREGLTGLSPGLARGGESEGRARWNAWLRDGIDRYGERHDALADDATSKLSPHLHFGTLSPVELVHRARARTTPGADDFVRQLCWRDFHHQVLAARPRAATADYRTRGDRWRSPDPADSSDSPASAGSADSAAEDVRAWQEGRTGYPVVDAAMRQLLHEGWMHNRGRLLTASFLTKTLYVDWRVGARHFQRLLVDGDLANNQLNWQWMAGTGTDSRPNRVLNPVLQGKRYDPDGAYVRRWVPELREVPGAAVHEPWKLPAEERARHGYPEPLLELAEGLRRFKRARGLD